MRSYRIHQHGAPDALQIDEIATPTPAAGELLIEVQAVGINFPDLLVISGDYQWLPPMPFTPGKDLAGVIRAVGAGVSGFAPGDRVMAQLEWGAWAEQAIALPQQTFAIPDELPFAEAAAMGLVYQTAWFALHERGRFSPGETVLIGGAAGGVGLAAVQIVKGLGGTVLAGVRNEAEAQAARESGADHLIDLSGDDLRESIRRQVHALTAGKGADVVLDPLGGAFFAGALRAMAWCGRLVVIGFAAGEIPSLKVNYLLLKNISVSGLQWTDYRDRRPDQVRAAQEQLLRLWRTGAVRPRVMRQFAFEDAAEALDLVRQGRVQGKAVLTLQQGA